MSAVNQLLKQFGEMKKMMRQMGNGTMPQMGGMGRMASMAARQAAKSEQSLPAGFEALGAGMVSAAATRGGGKNKKKKGGRVTPPKQR